jgi:DNA-binding protein HU-beta
MRKNEWIVEVAKEAKISQVEAGKILNTALKVIEDTLASGDKLTLTGFGTFEVRKSAARTGTHPRTGAKIKISARQRPAFTAGTVLRGAISPKSGARAKAKPAAKKPAAKKPAGRK